MKNKIIIYSSLLILGILLGTGGYYILSKNENTAHTHQEDEALYTCGMHPEIIEEEPGTCPICGMNLTPIKSSSNNAKNNSGERKILYWRAPMDPNEIYDEPGKSKMGMDLVPVYEDEAGASGVVTIDGSVIQNMNLKTEVVKRKDITSNIYTNGVLTIDERKEYVVTTKINGWAEKLYINFIGQKVTKGEKLVEIYSPELVAAQQELISAIEINEKLSSLSDNNIVEQAKNKLELFDISKGVIDKIISTKKVEKYLPLYAPFSGTVLTKTIIEGEKIKAGMELMTIADLNDLWLIADIYESELNLIELGASADISFNFNPSEIYKGKVSFIYPTLDDKTRTASIRINVNNNNNELKPAMFGSVEIETKETKILPVVPETAVLRSGKENIVVISLGEGKFKPVAVTLGNYADGYYQVLNGLKENDEIVTSGQFLIDSESSLRSAINMYSNESNNKHSDQETENKGLNEDVSKSEVKDSNSIVREGIIDLEAIDENKDGKVFQDPMDWNVISDEDGRCPLCNMFLKEVTIDEAKKNLKENGFEYK